VGSTPTLSRNDTIARKRFDMFKLGNDGYSMTFENGYTVSVRWSSNHYITGRTLKALEISAGQVNWSAVVEMSKALDGQVKRRGATDSVDAEVAVIGAAGEFLETPFNEYDTVIGHSTPDDVLKIMEWAAAL
jgi:hypothetical protein